MWDYLGEWKWKVQWVSEGGSDIPLENDALVALGEAPLETNAETRSCPESLGSEVRLARVLRLRSAIAAGTYRVPTEEVAEKMLGYAQRQRVAASRMYSV